MVMRKIVIFGATGMTGLLAVEIAIEKGLHVRAFVRDAAKLPVHLEGKIEPFVGNVKERRSVEAAVEGMDGVVILLGTGTSLAPTTLLSSGTKTIIAAMQAKHVKLLSACLSSYILYKPGLVPPMFVDIIHDHRRMYEAIQQSNLDWVAVLPPHITEEPPREVIIVQNPVERTGPRTITRTDLANQMIDLLFNSNYYKSTVAICNPDLP